MPIILCLREIMTVYYNATQLPKPKAVTGNIKSYVIFPTDFIFRVRNKKAFENGENLFSDPPIPTATFQKKNSICG